MIYQGKDAILTIDGKVVGHKPDGESLHKVFPAGEPLQSRRWTCPVCGVEGRSRVCLTPSCRAGICPVSGERD
jgi:hypothetical protein